MTENGPSRTSADAKKVDPILSNEPIYIGTVEYPDDGIRMHEDGTLWYHPEYDVNGVHRALLDPNSGYGNPPSA